MAKSRYSSSSAQRFYHSGIPAELPDAAAAFELLAVPPGEAATKELADYFRLRFFTQECAPNHLVTLRTEVDGWTRDLSGVYTEGAWNFHLDKARYPGGVVFKFVLDGCHPQEGGNLSIGMAQNADYDSTQVQFAQITPRYRHYYDNLQTGEDEAAQRYLHSNHDETIHYDLIVIGSGMVGGVVALNAAQRGRRVLLLEAGKLEFSTHTYNLPNTEWAHLPAQNHVINYVPAGGETEIIWYPQMNFGGRSVYWYGIIPRMKAWELTYFPPQVVTDLTGGGYDAAEALLRKHVTTGSFQEEIIAQLRTLFPENEVCDTPRAEHQPDLGQRSFVEQSTGTFSTAELLYDALTAQGTLGRDNLTVNLNHLVTRLEWTDRQITGVVCEDLVGNRTRRYHARKVVLAAGSIQSPRLALRSDLTNPNGRTGVGLTDHGSWFSAEFEIPAHSPYAGNDKHARIFFYADPNAQHRFNTEVEINPDYWRVRHANTAYWQDQLRQKTTTKIKFKSTCAAPLINSNYVEEAVNRDDKVRVRMPRIQFGLETRPAVEALGARILNFFGVQNFDLSQNEQLGYGNQGTPHHAGGTMRMSADGSGVVNSDLRHESYDNLYVCDASVFPFIPAANPSLTLVALAQRLAIHL